jgi:ketosteroid isomerase-like protein
MTMQVTQTEATLALIRHFNEGGFNTHDLDAVMGDMTEDTVFEVLGPAAFSGRWEGQAAVRAVFEAILGEFPAAHFETEDIFACEDRCSYSWIMSWANADGSTGAARGNDQYTVRGGKIAYKKTYLPPLG